MTILGENFGLDEPAVALEGIPLVVLETGAVQATADFTTGEITIMRDGHVHLRDEDRDDDE